MSNMNYCVSSTSSFQSHGFCISTTCWTFHACFLRIHLTIPKGTESIHRNCKNNNATKLIAIIKPKLSTFPQTCACRKREETLTVRLKNKSSPLDVA